jgi:transcriptional regulator with XRE-family HTH domain
MTFGELLSVLRDDVKGLNLTDVAKAAGVSIGSLSKYENLESAERLDVGTVQRIANALDVDWQPLTDPTRFQNVEAVRVFAASEALRIFAEQARIKPAQRSRLARLVEDPAAPVTLRGWSDFWRLVQRLSGKPSGTAAAPEQREERSRRAPLKMLSSAKSKTTSSAA